MFPGEVTVTYEALESVDGQCAGQTPNCTEVDGCFVDAFLQFTNQGIDKLYYDAGGRAIQLNPEDSLRLILPLANKLMDCGTSHTIDLYVTQTLTGSPSATVGVECVSCE